MEKSPRAWGSLQIHGLLRRIHARPGRHLVPVPTRAASEMQNPRSVASRWELRWPTLVFMQYAAREPGRGLGVGHFRNGELEECGGMWPYCMA